ncbi:hypothetical protein ACLNAQ_00990 [Bacillus sp. ICE1]|uniref:hypothetical protein n=1 Tax=Bacillus TaxID=1386 RepID=UPI00177B3DD1|nr:MULTISPECIES: hypothetical protein [Bacillus]MBE7958757.1 hypothetical protein [Bacillus amyloliquefaciens]MCC8303259.1 hypothetical protein [Bacillus sp. AF12]MDV9078850.1 hypothetical protein [Bacillus sp. ICE1]
MMPLQVKLQRVVKATKDEAMTVEQAADYLKVPKQYIPVLVARSDDLKMIGDETIITFTAAAFFQDIDKICKKKNGI